MSWWEGKGSLAGHTCHHPAVKSVLSTLHSVTFFSLFPFPSLPEPTQTLKSSVTSAFQSKQLNSCPIVFFLLSCICPAPGGEAEGIHFPLPHIPGHSHQEERKLVDLSELALISEAGKGRGAAVCSKDNAPPGKGTPGEGAVLGRSGLSKRTWQHLQTLRNKGFLERCFPWAPEEQILAGFAVMSSTELIHHPHRVPLIRDPLLELRAHPVPDRIRAGPSLCSAPTGRFFFICF